MDRLSKKIAIVRKFFTELNNDYKWAFEQVGIKDKEKCDIEHELELADMSYKEGCKWGTKLRNVLKERRVAKDTVELLESLHEFVESETFKSFFKGLETVQGKIRKAEDKLGDKRYHARIRDDISVSAPPSIEALLKEYKKEYKERRR